MSAAPEIVIDVHGLTKSFNGRPVVRDLSPQVKRGTIFGFLGPNGSGKTTTIRMLCGLLTPDQGSGTTLGFDIRTETDKIKRHVGYMTQRFSLYQDLSVRENLEFFAGAYGVPPELRRERAAWVLDFAGLAGRGGQITGSLPGGWKQRVAFGAAIMHEPRVLFLDEPTSGVDPIARRTFWTMINRLADEGAAVLITTHYLEEAEQCNRLGFMVGGELVAEGTPSGVKAAQGGHLLELITDHPQAAADLLKQTRERWRISLFGDRLHVVVDASPNVEIEGLTKELGVANIKVLSAYETPYSLEDVFISLVEKARK